MTPPLVFANLPSVDVMLDTDTPVGSITDNLMISKVSL